MEKYSELLLSTQLFEGLGRDEISSMMNCLGAQPLHVHKNETIFMEGDSAGRVGLVLEGAVQIVQDDFYGKRSVIAVVEPGDMFGEVFSFAEVETLPVSAFAMQESRVLLLDCRRVLTVCSNACRFHNQLIHNLLKILARKNMQLSRKIQLMSRKTTREKLMAFLLDQAKQKNASEFTIPFDRQALADHLGVERSAMSAEISKLKGDGRIETRGSWFRILPEPERI